DTDQWTTVPEAHSCLVSSAMKLITTGVGFGYDSSGEGTMGILKCLDFVGSPCDWPAGNVVGEVGLAPFHDFEDAVPDDVKSMLVDMAAALKSGDLLACVWEDCPGETDIADETAAPATTTTTTTTTTTEAPTTTAAACELGEGLSEEGIDPETCLPYGVLYWDTALDLGIEDTIDWGARCDTETGQLALPWFFRSPCMAPFEGDNGGATDRGVTADSIKIVYWIVQSSDPVVTYITDAIVNDDTEADVEDTMRKLLPYYEAYYETYGRSVDLTVMVASGLVWDHISARADAVKIAEEIDPFMVWGGPWLSNAFDEELMARGIACFACGPSQTPDYYEEHHPYGWSIGKSGPQLNLLVAEYIGKRLAGRNAIHAGDESFHDQERVFGRIWIEASEASVKSNTQFEENLAEYGVEVAASVSYALDPATIQESAANTIAKMKAAGVTSVIFNGDAVAPREFTREATAQGFYPEWILTGSVLVDTNVFARTYDQEQWAHAFGVSNGAARTSRESGGSNFVYEWWNGEPPAANDTIGVMDPFPATFYSFLAAAGPDLTVENFARAMLAAEPTARAITQPSLSWGTEGRWPEDMEPDHFGVDDITEVWWNPSQVGRDELDREGPGMYMFVDGGVRYLWGEQPDTDPKVFTMDGAIAMYEEPPEAEQSPYYDPLPSAPANN
ncbi:MAG: hypothetical protein MK191_06755, partial [Acidimicrobiales bacterium]|nr:hypothetical protein [Acidimicrobiales bacterium]